MMSSALTFASPRAPGRQALTSETRPPRCQHRGTPRTVCSQPAQPAAASRAPPRSSWMQSRAAAARRRGRLAQQIARAQGTAELADLDDFDAQVIDAEVIDNRIPVTVITGFLGSGKTTLLNNILTQDHGQRLAVIENEVGEIDIDSELVAASQRLDGREEARIMMLNNGCLCCTVRDDLVDMLTELADRRQDFDRVVIETTGLASPAPIIQTFFLDPAMADNIRLDGVVTLVDAKHVARHLDEEKPGDAVNEALQQIAYADRIVLNKTDLVTAEEADALEARLRGINSMAQILRAQRAQVGVDYVLGVGGFDLDRVEGEVNPELLRDSEHSHDHSHEHSEDCGEDCGHDHGHEHHDHSHSHEGSHSHAEAPGHGHSHSHSHSHGHKHDHVHDDRVSSVSIQIDGDMDLDMVNHWLGSLIQVRGEDLYRMKGVLAIAGFSDTFVFQGVHSLFEGSPARPWGEGEARTSRMVFIGRELDAELLREGFKDCLAERVQAARAEGWETQAAAAGEQP